MTCERCAKAETEARIYSDNGAGAECCAACARDWVEAVMASWTADLAVFLRTPQATPAQRAAQAARERRQEAALRAAEADRIAQAQAAKTAATEARKAALAKRDEGRARDAVDYVRSAGGSARPDDVAAHLGVSRRTLSRAVLPVAYERQWLRSPGTGVLVAT